MQTIKKLVAEPLDRDITIHRILGIERFLQLIHEESLTLMAPEKWQDPYECALQTLHENSGNTFHGEKVYGLCWSSEGRSDALWQIYSPNKLGIRISSTVGKLANAIHAEQSLLDKIYVGEVAYLPERTSKKLPYKWPTGKLHLNETDFSTSISTFANAIDELVTYHPNAIANDERKKARTFLVKRRAFQHEQEVRLLCFPNIEALRHVQNYRDKRNKVIKLKVSLKGLISQVELDPRMGDDVAEALVALIRPMLPHLEKPTQLKKSTLYTIPKSKGLPK